MSQNGDATAALLADTAVLLDATNVVDYYTQPLPAPLDSTLRQVVQRFMMGTSAQRQQYQALLSESQRALFGIFGHRAATLAVRQEDADWLRAGLAGVTIANYVIPERRRVETGLAIYHHVARKLALNPIDLFEEAATYASDAVAPLLLSFGRKTAVVLSHFGWRELKTPEGVKYTFDF